MSDKPWHGTASGYRHYSCRCSKCTKAHAVQENIDRNRRRSSPIPPTVSHGKYSTYINWGCRCHDCHDAAIEAMREYKKRHRAKAKHD